jgi:hypothetical protein
MRLRIAQAEIPARLLLFTFAPGRLLLWDWVRLRAAKSEACFLSCHSAQPEVNF